MSHSMVPPSAGSSAPANGSQGGRNPQNAKYPVGAHQAHGAAPQHVQPHRQGHQAPQQQQTLRQAGTAYSNYRPDMKQTQQVPMPNAGAPHMSSLPYGVTHSPMAQMPMNMPAASRIQGVYYPMARPQQSFTPENIFQNRLQGQLIQSFPYYQPVNGQYPAASTSFYPPNIHPSTLPQAIMTNAPQMAPAAPAPEPHVKPRERKVMKIFDPETKEEVKLGPSPAVPTQPAPPAAVPPHVVPQLIAQIPHVAPVVATPPANSYANPNVQVPSTQEPVLPKQAAQPVRHAEVPVLDRTEAPFVQQPPSAQAPVAAAADEKDLEIEATPRSAQVADEDEELRRKVEKQNQENLRKTQQASQNNSRKEKETVVSKGSVAVSKDGDEQTSGASAPTPVKEDGGAKALPEVAQGGDKKPSTTTATTKESDNAHKPNHEPVAKSQPPVADVPKVEEVQVEAEVEAPVEAQDDKGDVDALEEGEISDNDSEGSANLLDAYKPGQWSPMHPDGKKQYDRDFLLKLQFKDISKAPPTDMVKIEIFREISNTHTLSDSPGQGRTGQGYNDYRGDRGGNRNNSNTGGSMSGRPGRPFARPPDRPPRRVITLKSSISQDVKLHTTDTAWKPEKEAQDSDEALYKKVRSILNKLAPQHFDKLAGQVKALQINTEERLSSVINLVMEKALNETHFSATYAKLCYNVLSELNVTKKNPDNGQVQKVSFRKVLLQNCQSEFERDSTPEAKKAAEQQAIERQQKLEAAQTEQEKKELQFEFDEQDVKAKRRALGLMRFIGELYNLSILSFNVMHDCFCKLMMNPMDVDSIECACNLFRTIGKKFADDADAPPKIQNEPHKMKDKYIKLMDNLHKIIHENREAQKVGSNKPHLPQRVIFMLEDVWELKQRKWVPRRDEQAPKTLQQIQQEADQEKILATASAYGGGGSQGGNGGGGNRYNNSSMSGGDRGRRQYTSQSQSALPNSYKQTKQMAGSLNLNLSNMNLSASLGPGPLGPSSRTGQGWVTGASGGGSRNSSLRGSQRADLGESLSINSVNKFAPLEGNEMTRSQENSPSRRDAEHRRRGGDFSSQSDFMARGSAPSSRTPSQTAAAASLVVASGGETHSLQGENEDDGQTVRRYAQTILAEFTSSRNKESFLRDFCERAHQQNVNRYVSSFIELGCESPAKYEKAAEAITELHKHRILSTRQIEVILIEQLENAEEMVIDIPKYFVSMAEIVARLILNELNEQFDFRYILKFACKALQPYSSAKFLIPLFESINKMRSGGVAELWEKSGLTVRALVPDMSAEDVKRVEDALGTSAPAGEGLRLSKDELCSRFNAAFDETGDARDRLLRDIIHQAGKDKKSVVRACAHVLLNRGYKDGTFHAELTGMEKEAAQPLKDLFSRDVNRQALYALQSFMAEKLYPKELPSKFCIWLYDVELVEDETFIDWADNKESNEETTGYDLTLNAQNVEAFIKWLKIEEATTS